MNTFRTFAEAHPLRIDLPGGKQHVRFRDLRAAAASALHHGREIWDEANERAICLDECRRIVNQRQAA